MTAYTALSLRRAVKTY